MSVINPAVKAFEDRIAALESQLSEAQAKYCNMMDEHQRMLESPSKIDALEKRCAEWCAAAQDKIDYDQENQCPVCHCCGMELDGRGKGHRSDCLADLILSETHNTTLTSLSQRKERCALCGEQVTDWVDPEWAKGRICMDCESKREQS